MEPTVQVAAFGIIATIISTAGVVLVAYINKASPTAIKPVEQLFPDDVDDAEMFQLLLRKETAIKNREQAIEQLKATNEDLEAENERLRADRQYCREHHGG